MSGAMRERVLQFGPAQGLAGVLSVPSVPVEGAPHVVIVNAGIIHRVGPNRLYVEIARALAERGYTVLRFDLSGLGDSAACTSDGSLEESVLEDIRVAFDHLERTRGAREFVMLGLCAGANHSIAAAFAEPRIVGALLIDPTVARTRRSKLVHLTRRLRHAATLRALLTMRHPVWRRSPWRLRGEGVTQAVEAGQRMPAQARTRSRAEVSAALQRTIDRGVQLMYVFTGGVNHVYNYREQLFDLLPEVDFRDRLRLEFMPETDHAIVDAPSRTKLLHAIGEWFATSFAARGAPDVDEDADTMVEFEIG